MKTKLSVLFLVVLLGIAVLPSRASAQSLSGLWDATVVVNGNLEVPFRMEFSGSGSAAKGSFFNGDEKVTSTTGRFDKGSLLLSFDEYGTTLEATLKDGRLEGQYKRGTRGEPYPFQAKRFTPAAPDDGKTPSIAGLWDMPVASSKGESAWQLIVRQSGPEVSAAILRVDGDTGALTGRYRDGKFVLSHFSGERPYLIEVAPKPDGSLAITLNDYNGKRELPAFRPADARAKGLPEPTDPAQHTRVADAKKPFEFKFPDLSGRMVANTDARFLGKVVLVNITG